MQLFDSHAHCSDPLLLDKIPDHLTEAKYCSISDILSICTDLVTLEKGYELANESNRDAGGTESNQVPKIHLAAATGPCDVVKEGAIFWPHIEQAARSGKLVAIGEMGIDLFWEQASLSAQREYFSACCALALECELPLVIHCRDANMETKAFDTVVADLDRLYLGKNGARSVVFHCFSYSRREMQILRERGIYLSITGVVTYKNAQELKEVTKAVDAKGYLLETDAPYLTPRPRSLLKNVLQEKPQLNLSINRSSFLKVTAEYVAQLRGVPLEQVALETTSNARAFLGLVSV